MKEEQKVIDVSFPTQYWFSNQALYRVMGMIYVHLSEHDLHCSGLSVSISKDGVCTIVLERCSLYDNLVQITINERFSMEGVCGGTISVVQVRDAGDYGKCKYDHFQYGDAVADAGKAVEKFIDFGISAGLIDGLERVFEGEPWLNRY